MRAKNTIVKTAMPQRFLLKSLIAILSVSLGLLTMSAPAAHADAAITTQDVSVTAPVAGATPQSSTSDNNQYSTTISWNTNPLTFAANTIYTATVTIVPDNSFTLTGVAAD